MTAVAPEPMVAAKAYADEGQGFRTKLRKYYGEDYPAPDDDEGRKLAHIKKLRENGEPDALARYRQGTRNLLYVNGRQRLTWNKRNKTWEELPLLDEHECRASMNYIKPALRARMQRMTSGPVQFGITPPSNSLEDRDRAKIGVNFLQARYKQTNMREKIGQALELAYACGFSVLKSFWNRDIGPLTPASIRQVRTEPVLDDMGQPVLDQFGQPVTQPVRNPDGSAVVDELFVDQQRQIVERAEQAFQFRPGDTDTAVRTMFNIRLNPEALAWDVSAGLRWLIDTDLVALSVLRETWPEFAERIQETTKHETTLTFERMAAGAATSAGWASAFPAMGAPNKQGAGLGQLHEYWQLPDECFPAGRCITLCTDIPVYDGPFPQGIFPYTPIFDERAPLSPYGRPSVNDMVSPQDVINRHWSAIDAEMQLQGFGQYVAWDVPGVPEQITPESRKVMRIPMRNALRGRSIRDVFHRVEAGSVGGDRWNIIQGAKQALFDIAGYHEVSRGQVPPGVDSGVAIEHLLEEERGQLLPATHALEESLTDWADKQLGLARWGYADDVDRWLPVDRPDLGVQMETVNGKALPDPKAITVTLEGFKPHSPVAYRAEIKEAMKDGMIDPRRGLQLLDLGQGIAPALESEGRHYIRARRINLLIQQEQIQVQTIPPTPDPLTGEEMAPAEHVTLMPDGTPVVLEDDDDHVVHLRVLDEIALDDTQRPAVREVALIIKQQRRAALQKLMPPAPDPAAAPVAA